MTTSQAIANSAKISTYHWKAFLADGEARRLHSSGITNKGFEPEMISPDGFKFSTLNKKFPNEPFCVVYDQDYVFEILCKHLEKLGAIRNGQTDELLITWLLEQLATYALGYAARCKNTSTVIEHKAEELSKAFPGKSYKEWLDDLRSNMFPRGALPEHQPIE